MPRRRSALSVILRLVLTLAVLLVLGGIVALAAFDPNTLKPRIVAAVERVSGRRFAIGGPLRLQWHGGLLIEATDLRVGNLPGGSRPDMLVIPAVTAQVALLPLLSGEARVDLLLLVAPDLLLERDAAGRGNWQFDPAPMPANKPAADSGPAGLSFRPALRIVSMLTQDGKLAWHDGAGTRTYPFGIEGSATLFSGVQSYDAQATVTGANMVPLPYGERLHDPALRVRVQTARPTLAELTATWGVDRVRAHATLPPLEVLAAGGTDRLPVDLALEGSAGTATVKGQLAGRALDADVSAQVPQAGAIGLGDGAASLVAHVVTGPDSVTVSNIAFQAVLGDLEGTLAVTVAARPKLAGSITSRHFDLGRLRTALATYDQPAAIPPPPAAPVTAPATAVAPPAPHLFSDRPLPFDRLRTADADLQFVATELVDAPVTYRDVAGHLVLQDGRLALDPLAGAWPGGQLTGSAHVDAAAGPPAVAIVLHAPAVALASVLAVAGLPGLASGSAQLDLDLKAIGDNPRALAASIDGHATLSSVDGAVDNRLLANILAAARLPPLGGSGRTALRCLAVRLVAEQGRVAVEPLIIDTGRLLLQGAGTVDLGGELIAMQLRPMLRAGPGIVVPVHVTGPLRTPKIGIDSVASLTGTSLTGLLGDHGGDPCVTALATMRGGPVALPPLPPPNVKLPKPADLLQSLLR